MTAVVDFSNAMIQCEISREGLRVRFGPRLAVIIELRFFVEATNQIYFATCIFFVQILASLFPSTSTLFPFSCRARKEASDETTQGGKRKKMIKIKSLNWIREKEKKCKETHCRMKGRKKKEKENWQNLNSNSERKWTDLREIDRKLERNRNDTNVLKIYSGVKKGIQSKKT